MANPSLILKQDRDFLVEVNVNGNPETTNGFLLRRCAFGLTTPEGVECVGGYDLDVNGTWRAGINRVPEDEDDGDSEPLGVFASRDEAVTALWAARERAYAVHPRY